MLLDTYLRQLRLPTFLHNYQKFAEDAARSNQDYVWTLAKITLTTEKTGCLVTTSRRARITGSRCAFETSQYARWQAIGD